MTLRLASTFLWLFAVPISFLLLEIIWTSVDDERQMLRDLFSGTRLIRNNAKPIGPGRTTTLTETDPAADLVQSREILIVQCHNCGMRVMPKSNGLCPSCQMRISIERKEGGE